MLLLTTFMALSLLSTVSARIIGIAAPSTIAPNSNFTITIITENYIQSVADISAVFGLTQAPHAGYLGTVLTSTYLGPSKSNIVTNISIDVTLPTWATPAPGYTLTAAITSLYGASAEVTTTLFNLPNIIISPPATSSDLISDTSGTDLCAASSPSTSAIATTLTTAIASATPVSPSATSASIATSSASACTDFGANGNPTNLPIFIQGVNTELNVLIQDLLASEAASAQATYSCIEPYFDIIAHMITKDYDPCAGYESANDQPLAVTVAIGVLQTIQGALNTAMQDVIDSDGKAAIVAVCTAKASFVQDGMWLAVYRPGYTGN